MNSYPQKIDNIIVLDSNFILIPYQFKIDYLEEINYKLEGRKRFIIFKQVLDELEAKKKREEHSIKFQKELSGGLEYISQNKQKYDILNRPDIKHKEETTDDFLIRKTVDLRNEGRKLYLATNDSELRKKAKKSEIYLIFLRQKKFLSFD